MAKVLNITGTPAMLDALVEDLQESGEAKLDSGHVPVRSDLALTIVLREDDEDDEADELSYDFGEE